MSIGPWQPLWIGEHSRQLYAALHAPVPHASLGVVFVPPLLHEQPRSRRFLTEAASELAAIGIPVLRFDFYGTADSAGHGAELDFATMRDDLTRTVHALRALAHVDRVALLAWRAGALPTWNWLRHGGEVSSVVLWEPVLSGTEWIAELEEADRHERCSPERYTGVLPQAADFDDGQLMGYPVSNAFRVQCAGVDIRAGDTPGRDVPMWMVERDGDRTASLTRDRTFVLPTDAPQFAGSTRMDVSLFMSPRMQHTIRGIGEALLEGV